MSAIKTFAIFLATLGIFAGAIAISMSVWNECRRDGNSFFYCMRLVSK